MSKQRILIDSLYINRGGVEVMMWNLIPYLLDKGYDITLAAAHWPGNENTDIIPPEIHYVERYKRRKDCRQYSPAWFLDRLRCRIFEAKVERKLSSQNFDIALAMQEKRTMLRTDRLRAKRKFAWVHTDYTSNPNRNAVFSSPEEELACMRRFEKIICVSQAAKNGILRTIGDPGNLVVCYNPIDAKAVRKRSQEPCPLSRPKDRPLLVSVGRLSAEKNYILLLEVCARLREAFDFEVWIIGDGEERPKLERYIAEHSLSQVRLLGSQSNPFPYLRQADLFISSSFTESYGLAVQEALILGVPAVAVINAGVEESLDRRFGLIVENDPDALEDAVRSLLADTVTLNKLHERIEQEFDISELFEKRLDDIYALLEQKG